MGHTDGPWEIGTKDSFDTLNANLITHHGSAVALVYGIPQNKTLEECLEIKRCERFIGNARLIASAPELLAALEECVPIVRSVMRAQPNSDLAQVYSDVLNRSSAAIRKARGK